MATFQVQIEDMIGVVETTAGSATSDTTALSSFLTDGAKEVINMMNPSMLITCATEQTFTPKAVGSEDETLNTTKIFNVRRNDGTIDQPCRLIMSSMKGRASDSLEMDFASKTDPVYYLENNKINILPSSSTGVGKYSEVQFPSITHSDSAISNFADEAEYVVVLYAAMKGAERIVANYLDDEDIELAGSRAQQYNWAVGQYNKAVQGLMR